MYIDTSHAIPSLTTSEFVNLMYALRSHYRTNPLASYALPSHVAVGAALETLPEAARVENKKFEVSSEEFVTNEEGVLNKDAKRYVRDRDFDDFKRRMDDNRLRMKEIANENIDKYIDEMIRIGKDNPAARNAIASVCSLALDFFNSILSQFVSFVGELVESIVQLAERAFARIKDFGASAIRSIKSFFGGIFSLPDGPTTQRSYLGVHPDYEIGTYVPST